MSPLARSLLALAALLAAANAQQNCNIPPLIVGRQTLLHIELNPVDVPPPGGRVSVQDECRNRDVGDARLVGLLVQLCNKDPYGMPPRVNAEVPYLPANVDVLCPDGCAYGATAQIVLYCV